MTDHITALNLILLGKRGEVSAETQASLHSAHAITAGGSITETGREMLRREASRAHVNKETFGEFMNLARRYKSLAERRPEKREGLAREVRYCAKRCLAVAKEHPIFTYADETLARARTLADFS